MVKHGENGNIGVHMSHCNQGEYEGSCKYGDTDCPALTDEKLNAAKKQPERYVKLSEVGDVISGYCSNQSEMQSMLGHLNQLETYTMDDE